jgi:hypothetical protein
MKLTAFMRVLIVGILVVMGSLAKSQSFYEKMMELNISLADTSNNWTELERAAGVFNRLSNGSDKDWTACYYMSLCYIRTADLVIKKDTLLAKTKLAQAKWTLKAADSIRAAEIENKILRVYLDLMELRLKKPDPVKIKLLDERITELKKNNSENPRIEVLNAYQNIIFYPRDKSKNAKVKEYLSGAEILFKKEKYAEYAPRWGKKWCGELQKRYGTKN